MFFSFSMVRKGKKKFILRKKGGNGKSRHTKHFHYQTLGDVMGNQKGPRSIL